MTPPTPIAALDASVATRPAVHLGAIDRGRRYGEGEAAVDALRAVTLAVPSGQFCAVMGPSGSGKSTLLHHLAGLDTPTSGTVVLDGHDLSKMKDDALTRMR